MNNTENLVKYNSDQYDLDVLKNLQDELKTVMKKERSLKERIKNHLVMMESKKEPIVKTAHPNSGLISRDLDLVYDLISKRKKVLTYEIIDFLNKKLKNQMTRWTNERQVELDSNIFMGCMGVHIKRDKRFTFEKTNGTTVWRIA
jgi:hypothetical protein